MAEHIRSTLTVTESGQALTETQDGITMPADYSFATVNDYVHGVGRTYEELECLCLGMASEIERLTNHIDKLKRGEFICCKCGGRTPCTYPVSHDN